MRFVGGSVRNSSIRLAVAGVLVVLGTAASGQDVPTAATAPGINLRRTVTVDVVQRTKDAVVYISTTKIVSASPFGDDPFFRQFVPPQNMAVQSLGSGFVVHEDGYIVTNNHVIDRAREIKVDLPDGKKLDAELVSADPEADLAVLRVKADKPLPYLQLGDSSDLMIGEPVIAVGNPLGFSHSVSTGIVSAVHRTLEDPRIKLEDLIQTDAAINPGNSGGPLLNAYGQVIGINTAIRGDAQNIGFAIQVNKLRDMIPALMNPAQVAKVDVPVKLKESRRVLPPATVQCSVALANGPQTTPITSINGHPPRDIVDAYVQLLKVTSDKQVTIEFQKDAPATFTARTVAPPDAIVQAKKLLGVTVEPLTPLLAQKYGVDVANGMIINEVQNGSAAATAGIEPGDVILAIGNYQVRNLDDFGTLLAALPRNRRIPVFIRRGNQQGYLSLRLP
jgi:serine protease Do